MPKPVLRRFWLLFAQVATVCLAALFVVATLRPDLLARVGGRKNVVVVEETRATVAGPKIESLADAAKKAMPSVVNIYTSKEVRQRSPLLDDPLLRRFFPGLSEGEPRRATSLGSGVIVSGEGYVLTNNHVIEGADDIQLVLADGRRMHATVRGSDPESDLAVLKADGKDLPAITLGTLDNVQVGDAVLAIGNPFGFGQTVTSGIVSAIGRSGLHINTFENFIQTDAAINPGNSGGALVDVRGNLVGINTAIYSRSGGSMGIGFAIPVSTARVVMDQIIRSGSVTRGWIGVELQEITPALAESFGLADTHGAIIAGVLPGGPADKAGVKLGDVIFAVNDNPVADHQGVLNLVAALKPGSSAKLRLKRQAQTLELAVTVGRRPKPQPRE